MKPIPFFPYPELFKSDEAQLLEVLRDVCSRGAYILQKDCQQFERALEQLTGARHAIGVANGTDAIVLGLKAVGIGAGDEVILPSHTYIATAAALHWVGATPVLAECGADHMLEPADIAHRITPRTRAIMPVQLNGRTCDMARIRGIADTHGLLIVEDAAQALGSRFEGKCAGTFGAFGTYSFYPAKLLGCFGDGGAVVTDDDAIAREIRLLRDHGRDESGRVVAWGVNSRLDNLQAAVLNHKLKTFALDITRRRAIAARYQTRLGALPHLTLPPAPDADPRHFDVYQNYELEAEHRDRLREHLHANGVRTLVQWGGVPVHQFTELGFTARLPRTDTFFKSCLMLPMNTTLADGDIDAICALIEDFYAGEAANV